jgi:DNA-directed RNA polymerase specialized sigma24 family protein
MANQNHYVDNKKLFDVLVKYKKAVAKRPKTPPPIPEYVGECLLKIATRLSHKANFAQYTFREDMISDAVENCILYMHNFDPAKSSNPFAYFTQITHFAFIRRIEREKKQSYIKLKYAMEQSFQHADYTTQDGDSANIKDPAWMSYENVHEFIRDYEHKLVTHRMRRALSETDHDGIVSFDILDEEEDVEHERGVDGEVERFADDEEDAETDDTIEEL